nr:MAG TPA: hypothetical protein [Caudoviricetes sp.]
MRRKLADAWARGSSGPRLRGSLHPPPGQLKFSPLPEIPRPPLRAGFFPHGRVGGCPAAVKARARSLRERSAKAQNVAETQRELNHMA